jgi:DNA helicase HerA-like ATPase
VPERDPTCIGRVRQVLGAQVTVALDPQLAGIAPIYRGRLLSIGQIGSLVRVPQGLVDLVGTVSLVGIAELAGAQPPVATVQTGERWLQLQLLGEIDRGTGQFQRGVGTYPALDDPVHFATADDLRSVFPPSDSEHLRVGRLAAAEEVPISVDASKLVIRHAAVVGSTGSGKTSAVASILQGLMGGGWDAANVVVIDPHGEYAKAVGSQGAVRSVLGTGENRLRVPHWALPARDILRTFAGAAGGGARDRFIELVRERRRAFVNAADWLHLDPAAITEDTPVPFDLKDVWYVLDRENRTTLWDKADLETEALESEGNASELVSATFTQYGPGATPPHQAGTFAAYGSTPELLRLGLRDPRLQFLLEPEADPSGGDPLNEAMLEWVGGRKPVSILDFAGVPEGAAELAIGVVLDLLFEATVRTSADGPGIGRPSPVLVVLEEAHRYLGSDAAPMARDAANRIAREGRKYGIGLMLVTQRPSELPDTALAQCGTLISLRLSNQSDQGKIRAALPDSVAGLASALPSLRTGEALISGEALVLPARTIIDRPDPLPQAEDPSLLPWRDEPSLPNLAPALAAWRGTYEVNDDGD